MRFQKTPLFTIVMLFSLSGACADPVIPNRMDTDATGTTSGIGETGLASTIVIDSSGGNDTGGMGSCGGSTAFSSSPSSSGPGLDIGSSDTTINDSSEGTSESENCLNPSPGLVHWWPGEGNANDIVGGLAGISTSLTYSLGVDGNQAFEFNGMDSRIELTHADSLNLSELTLSAWIYLNNLGNHQYIFIKDSETFWGTWHSYQLFVSSTDRLTLGLGDGTNPVWILTTESSLTDQEWHHVAGTYDGNTLRIYVDGTIAGESTIGPVDIYYHTNPLRLGIIYEMGAYYYPFDGRLDELQIHDRALSDIEILDIYQAGGDFCSR